MSEIMFRVTITVPNNVIKVFLDELRKLFKLLLKCLKIKGTFRTAPTNLIPRNNLDLFFNIQQNV